MIPVALMRSIPSDLIERIRDGSVSLLWDPVGIQQQGTNFDIQFVERENGETYSATAQALEEPVMVNSVLFTRAADAISTEPVGIVRKHILRELALQPTDPSTLAQNVAVELRTLLRDSSPSLDTVRHELAACTVPLRGGRLDFDPSLAHVVQMNWFATESQKRQAANRLAPVLHAANKSVDHLKSYMDRDVYMGLFSRGIMSGMSSRGDPRCSSPTSESEGSDNEQSAKSVQKKSDAAQYRRPYQAMEEIREDWRLGDLNAVSLLESSTLAAAQRKLQEVIDRNTDCNVLHELPFGSTSDYDAACDGFRSLVALYSQVDEVLRLHERTCADFRGALQSENGCSEALQADMLKWIRLQQPARFALVETLRLMRRGISFWRRELMDYGGMQGFLCS